MLNQDKIALAMALTLKLNYQWILKKDMKRW